MITRRQLLAITVVSAGLSASRIRLLPAAPIEMPEHEPSAGFGRKLWIALGDGEEIEAFGRQPVTFHVDRLLVSNEVAVYFAEATEVYDVTTFHIFEADGVMIFKGKLAAMLRTEAGVLPSFDQGALVFDIHGDARA